MKILAIAFVLMAVGAAENDSYVMGPYKVSFDTGFPKFDYSVNIEEPIISETLSGRQIEYILNLTNKSDVFLGTLFINLIYMEGGRDIPSNSTKEMALKSKLYNMDKNFYIWDSAIRKIDGTYGAAVQGFSFPVIAYLAYYNPPFDPEHLSVTIFSGYPEKEDFLTLLKTIHVEKLNATA
ncbi:MAG: hypothetical protein A4E48_00412 [Methanosaeta sp. PtaU1.Bin060]|nr:MAG: hypothetical protein A4E48_00412 [Methanosaeta sp. PtaU1.Bin060]